MTLNKTRQRSFNALVTGLFVLALAGTLPAQEALLVLDPAQTRIDFTLGDVLHTVHGTFKLKQGTIHVDPATGTATGLVVVDATSGDSGNGARDRKMHKDILESQKYPEITITPVRIQGHLAHQGVSQIELQGFFKIHGTEHEITMQVAVQVAADQLTAATHFVVPYAQWGMKNPSTFIFRVSDKVDIDIHAAGRLTFPPENR
jgi:polyisoprenoid-binding protein YceI